MPEISHRNLIRGAAVVGGAAAAAATVSASAAAEGANAATTVQAAGQASGPRHGDIRDIKHVMILMQENRITIHLENGQPSVTG
jgi:phospholipase C